jgi:hypothetical protein
MNRHVVTSLAAVSFALGIGSTAAGATKRAPYPEVKVNVAESYDDDPEFAAMRKAFKDAVEKKDGDAVAALVGPTFVWKMGGDLHDYFDLGRDAVHNFKVVFGFRLPDKDTDGGVADGPFWDSLTTFANDPTSFRKGDNLVCTPTMANVVDDKAFELADSKLATGDEPVDWYFTLGDTAVTNAPDDKGPPIGRLGAVLVPLLSIHPPVPEKGPVPPATHYEVLMPNGRAGWIPVDAARPFLSGYVCYAKTPTGQWKIGLFDQPADR